MYDISSKMQGKKNTILQYKIFSNKKKTERKSLWSELQPRTDKQALRIQKALVYQQLSQPIGLEPYISKFPNKTQSRFQVLFLTFHLGKLLVWEGLSLL